jgi:hypothetical protein
MGVKPKAGGGGSMVTIISSVFVVAGVAIYLLDPYLFQNMITTVARWMR